VLRLAFLGSAPFSVPSLRACAEAHDVCAVVTQPDRPGNRGKPAARPVADAARELSLPLLQPRRLRDADATDALLALDLDAVVVAAYGQILPVRLLDGVRLGGVNVHPSLLPRWRGAAPAAAAILHGDPQSGVCIMRMEEGLDSGPIYASEAVALAPDVTTPVLMEDLADRGARLLLSVLGGLEAGAVKAEPQDEGLVTHIHRFTRADGELRWALPSAQIDRCVRALTPWPGTVVDLGGQTVRLIAGRPEARTSVDEPGTILEQDHRTALVACGEGAYRVATVQPPGQRAMDAAAYLRGRR